MGFFKQLFNKKELTNRPPLGVGGKAASANLTPSEDVGATAAVRNLEIKSKRLSNHLFTGE